MAKKKKENADQLIVVGWREWIRLPALKIHHIKIKVDTGAQTSALHAEDISAFYEDGKTWVRFKLRPLQEPHDQEVTCTAEVVDHRIVSDSGGHREKRYVIKSEMFMGAHSWPIEITLTNRATMTYRMLLGREAMKHVLVHPHKAFLHGQPSHPERAYRKRGKK